MTGRSDKVEKGVDSVIPESWVSFNPGLFGEDIIVLPFQVSCDLGKACFIVDLVAESGSVDDSQCNASSFFFKVYN